MEPDYDGSDPWWAVPLFLFILLFGAPLCIWAGIWVVMGYVNLLMFFASKLPWPPFV